jgi:DNA-binding GntR family transcriptional regulator
MTLQNFPSGRRRGGTTLTPDLVVQTYERLRSLIVAGKLSPGSRIIESDLAERLGVSRTPLRSALQRLQQEGFVSALGGGRNARLVVSPLTAEDCRELLTLLGALEGITARAAAGLPAGQRKALTRDLSRLNGEMETLLHTASPSPDDVFRVHSEFHQAHLKLAGTPRTQSLYSSISPQAERYRRVYITATPHGLEGEVDEHKPIIDAIAKGDGPGAQLAVQANWEAAADRLGQLVDRLGDRGSW